MPRRTSIVSICMACVSLLIATPAFADQDADGWTVEQGDCNDANKDVNPDQPEICGDRLDNDCNGMFDDGCDGRIRQATVEGGGCGSATNDDLNQTGPATTGTVAMLGTNGAAALLFLPVVALRRRQQQDG